jgi:iron complex outermembrane receptor protein/outer membrane receptor for ferrienterochelin and colicins
VGNQYIYDNAKVPNYWFFAAMVERALGPVHIILNCENLFNVRQSDFGQVVSGTRTRPSFVSIWAPQEGIIVNLAVKWTLERD